MKDTNQYNLDVGQRIKEARKMNKMTIEELGNKVNLTKGTVSRYEQGLIKSLDVEKLNEFANALNVSPIYLFGTSDDTVEVQLPMNEPVTFINVYAPISCGLGSFNEDNVISTISVPSSMLPKNKNDLFAQYAQGDSMIDKGIEDGDLLIFAKGICNSGDIGCFCIDENVATCKTLKIVGSQVILMPANEKYEPIIVEVEKYKCVGKLVLRISKA